MTLTYNLLGKYIHQVDERNKDLITESVLGINIDKFFMPSVANVIGTDLSNYKLLNKYRFACNPMHVGRDCRLPVSLYQENVPAIVSPAYFTFEINNSCELDPEYLMLCFRRPLFDKFCTFKTDASVRGGISWDDLCSINIPIPSTIEEQQKIVSDYKVITDRIEVLKRLNTNLEKQISTIFCEKFKPLSSDMQGSYELKSILSFNNGYAFSSNDYIDKGSYKIVTIGNVYDGYVDTTKVNYLNKISDQIRKLSLLNVGDIVISLTGEIGRTALIKEENLLLNQRVARIV